MSVNYTEDQAYAISSFMLANGHMPNVNRDGKVLVDLSGLNQNSNLIDAARHAIEAWSEAGIPVEEGFDPALTGSAQIKFVVSDSNKNYAYDVLNGANEVEYREVGLMDHWTIQTSRTWGDETTTAIHELGHALGLYHAGDYNGGFSESSMISDIESVQVSVMSYAQPLRLWDQIPLDLPYQVEGNPNIEGSILSPLSPMMSDYLAIKEAWDIKYLNPGNDYYDFHDVFEAQIKYGFGFTIFDEQGNDTVDFRSLSQFGGVRFDLRAGYSSDVGGFENNVFVGFNTHIEKTIGTSNADNFIGSDFNETFEGLDGNDSIDGGGGDDIIRGDQGNDNLHGSAGSDKFYAEEGYDKIDGGVGLETDIDRLDYSPVNFLFTEVVFDENDVPIERNLGMLALDNQIRFGLNGQVYTDTFVEIETLVGSKFADIFKNVDVDAVYGGSGNDIINQPDIEGGLLLLGEGGNDTIYGGHGDDLISGGSDNDVLEGGAGKDTIDGGSGFDSVSYGRSETGVVVDLRGGLASSDGYSVTSSDTLISIEGVIGSDHADVLHTQDRKDGTYSTAQGGEGNDTIYGHGYRSKIYGNDGDDTLYGRGTSGSMVGTTTHIYGGEGNDTIYGNTDNGSSGTLDGGSGNDMIYGQRGSFTIKGGDGNDFIHAGTYSSSQNTTANGGSDSDLFFVEKSAVVTDFDPGEDFIVFNKSGLDGDSWLAGYEHAFKLVQSGSDVLVKWGYSYEGYTIRIKNVMVSEFVGSGANQNYSVDYRGGALSTYETLKAEPGAGLILEGHQWNQSLYGAGGDDVISGNGGYDRIYGYAGDDLLDGGEKGDRLYAGSGDDTLIGGEGDDELHGDSGNDTLSGGVGADEITGGRGDDTMSGGDGTDTFFFRSAFGKDVISDFEEGDVLRITTDGLLSFSGLTVSDDGTLVRFSGMGAPSIMLEDVTLSESSVRQGNGEILIAQGVEIVGNDLANDLSGGVGFDILRGLGGDDTLDGGAGEDVIEGGDGDDLILASSGADVIDGGAGFDAIDYSGSSQGVYVSGGRFRGPGNDYDTVTGIEKIIGSDGYDSVYGWDVLSGTTPDMTDPGYYQGLVFEGRGGNDRVYGGLGADTLLGQDGDDQIFGTYYGEDETAIGAGDHLDGGAGNDEIEGSGHSDLILGGGGRDRLVGHAGADTLDGGAGNDHLTGGLGDDILTGGAGGDIFAMTSGDGSDLITDFVLGEDRFEFRALGEQRLASVDTVDTALSDGTIRTDSILRFDQVDPTGLGTDLVQNVTLHGVELDLSDVDQFLLEDGTTLFSIGDIPPIIGTDGDDDIEGTDGGDMISGLGGRDYIRAMGGSDTVDGGAGDDVIFADDYLFETAGNDVLTGGEGRDEFIFESHFGDDVITDFETGDRVEVMTWDLMFQGMTQTATDTVLTFTMQDWYSGDTLTSTLTFEDRLLDQGAIINDGYSVRVDEMYLDYMF